MRSFYLVITACLTLPFLSPDYHSFKTVLGLEMEEAIANAQWGKYGQPFLQLCIQHKRDTMRFALSYISANQINKLASLISARKTVPQIADPAALLHSRYDFQPAGVPSSKQSSTTASTHRSKFKPAMPSWFSFVIYIPHDIRFVPLLATSFPMYIFYALLISQYRSPLQINTK